MKHSIGWCVLAIPGGVGVGVGCGGGRATASAVLLPRSEVAAKAPASRAAQARRFDYPSTRRTDDADVLHGVKVSDPYRWLEAEDEEVTRWFGAQDRRARREIERLDAVGELVSEMKALYAEPLPPLPTRRGRLTFTRQGPTLRVRSGDVGAPDSSSDRVVFDEGALPPGLRMTSFVPSREGDFVAVETSQNGADMRSVRIVETRTARVVDEPPGRRRH